jgi:hypothetical protein
MLFGRKPFQAVFFSCCKYKPPFFKKLQNYYLTCLRFVKRAMLLLFCVSFFDVNILNIYGWGGLVQPGDQEPDLAEYCLLVVQGTRGPSVLLIINCMMGTFLLLW